MKLILMLFLLISGRLMAFDYFQQKINYWDKKEEKTVPVVTEEKSKSQEKVEKKTNDSFDWKKQLDPKNDDFFKEGDYTPPAAFMELAREPTDENITNWFKLVDKKNELSSRLSARIQEYLRKNQKLKVEERVQLVEAQKVLPQKAEDNTRYRFRMYFESSCPHCKRMMTTLQELQELGYYVEVRQVDHNSQVAKAIPFPLEYATPQELKEKGINSWPVLFVGDLAKKVTYRLNGYQPTEKVLSAIQNR